MKKYHLGVLGATGMVGQRMLALLDGHPWFDVAAVAASENSAGKRYGDAAAWQLDQAMPVWLPDMTVRSCVPDFACDAVLSALDANVAGDIEAAFAKAGYPVISNARNFRMEPDVPLVIPEINAGHLGAVGLQQEKRAWRDGFIVTNPNCSTVGLVVALKPLQEAFGLRKVMVTTMQALSGAGYPGVSSLDILDNVVPFIKGEEEKIETETRKLLGDFDGARFTDAEIAVSAHCNRVQVRDGHLECVSVELEQQASPEDVIAAWRSYRPAIAEKNLPSVPQPLIVYREEDNRPQPRRDRDAGRGMAVTVGRLRHCNILQYKFVLLSHNTVRGAAGAAIANAELLAAEGLLD